MKALIASTALVLAGASAFAQTVIVVDEGAEAEIDSTSGVLDDRVEGARAVSNEGSGMTTQSGAATETVHAGAPADNMSDGLPEGTTTNIPSLEDGTVVDNPRTPATAVIADGRVETEVTAQPTGAADARATPAGDGAVVGTDVAMDGTAPDATPRAPVIERAGMTPLLHDTLSLPQLEGVDVYDVEDERLGEIGYTINAAASGMGHPLAILSMGGFLGLGDREVALPLSSMTFVRAEEGIRAYLDATEEQLEAMPDYEG